MRTLLIAATVLLLSCGENASKQKKEPLLTDTTAKTTDTAAKQPDQPIVYTAPYEAVINTSLQEKWGNQWHVLNDQEAHWMKDAFDYFIVPKRKTEPNYPYIAKGDFNGDGKEDMAAVITDSLKKKYRVAILLDTSKILLWDEDIMEDAAISTVPKSDIDGMDGEKTKKVKMKGDGINVEYFEKASFVLYWDKSGFKRIQTGD
ncbi:MAG TPA: hypothetical protein VGO58_10730 [Chitinophagaceae bacterium]|nr:hypothetical protein [Chitinophagaceae bacterium]